MRTAKTPRPAPVRPSTPALPAPTVGRLVAVEDGRGVVETGGGVIPARTVVPLAAGDIGREALLVFPDGDRRAAVIVGLLEPVASGAKPTARLDGDRLVLSAEREIVLECGEASITLTRAGKVLIRGTYVLTRSSGVNRIKGASVQIN